MKRLLPFILIFYIILCSLSASAQVTDIDGNVYQTVTIGTQVWMKENLKTTKYNDGTSILNVTDNVAWGNLTTPGYCWYNNDETANKNIYGALYNWYTVNTGKLCPSGWHVPTDSEIKTLEMYLGLTQAEADAVQVYRGTDQGNKLKEAGNLHWSSPSAGTNLSGFTALPSAYRDVYGGSGGFFYNLTNVFCLWSSTEYNTSWAWYHYLINTESGIGRDSYYKKNGYSVRCLKDNLSSQPSITSYSPTSGPSGTSVTITGTSFSTTPSNNIVWFGAVKAAVTAATSTQLTVTVPSGTTYQPITVTVNGLTAYSSKPFNVTFPSGQTIDASSVSTKVDLTTGTNPYGSSICDLDGDGKPDLVVANLNSNTVSIFRNISTSGSINSGSFDSKIDLTTGTGPISVTVGDIDGDGKPDLITTNNTSNTVSIFRNISTAGSITLSSFSAKIDLNTGINPYITAIGDIDGDGKSDLVVTNYTSNTISIYRNTSSIGSITIGSFSNKVDFNAGTGPVVIKICDLDGDNKPDLVFVNSTSNTVSVLRNTSISGSLTSNSFATNIDFSTGAGVGTTGLAIADFDSDGKTDIAVTNHWVNSVSIFRNVSSTGSFTTSSLSSKVDFPTGTLPYFSDIADFNGDGKPDLAVANQNSNSVSIFKNLSSSGAINTGSFANRVDFVVGTGPVGLTVCDIDGDSKPDIVVANYNSNNISILRNTIANSTLPSVPEVGIITQPTCAISTGSVVLNGLPSTGTWTLTRSPGGVTTQGTGTSTTISGLEPGTYTYTVTDTYNNTSASSSNIVINTPSGAPSAPTAGTIVQPTCTTPTGSVDIGGLPPSGTWTLTITPGGTSTGTGTHAPVSGLSPGAYSFKVTDAAGCTSAPLENVTIQVVPVGNVPVIEKKWNSVIICYNINNVFSSWQWYRGTELVSTETTKAYYNTNKIAGSYKVLTTDKGGCKNYSNSIDIVAGAKSLSVYPNPADGNITVSLTDESRGKTLVEIFNSSGLKVIELQTDKSDDNLIRELNINKLDQGTYTIKVTVNKEDISFTRLVITR